MAILEVEMRLKRWKNTFSVCPVNKWEKERSVLGLRLEFLNYNGDYDIVCGCVCKWILLEDKSLTGAPFFYNEYNFIDSCYITKSVISFSALRLRFETSM